MLVFILGIIIILSRCDTEVLRHDVSALSLKQEQHEAAEHSEIKRLVGCEISNRFATPKDQLNQCKGAF
jgi:hypothetical protein